MQAIHTKYLGPTNYRPGRIKAIAEGGRSVTIGYDSSGTSEQCHFKAVKALCEKLDWHGTLQGGDLNSGGYVFVFVNEWERYEV